MESTLVIDSCNCQADFPKWSGCFPMWLGWARFPTGAWLRYFAARIAPPRRQIARWKQEMPKVTPQHSQSASNTLSRIGIAGNSKIFKRPVSAVHVSVNVCGSPKGNDIATHRPYSPTHGSEADHDHHNNTHGYPGAFAVGLSQRHRHPVSGGAVHTRSHGRNRERVRHRSFGLRLHVAGRGQTVMRRVR